MKRRTVIRLVLTLTVPMVALAYIFWKIDVGKTLHILANAQSLVLRVVGQDRVPHRPANGLALEAPAEGEGHPGQRRLAYPRVLRLRYSRQPDASHLGRRRRRPDLRDGETAPGQRRAGGGVDHPGAGARRSGYLILAGIGIALAYGNYDIGIYLWVEVAFVVLTVIAGIVLFSKRARPLLRRFVPILKKLWVERHVRAVYEGMHSYRHNAKLLLFVTCVTLLLQAARVVSVWAGGEAVGVHLSIRPDFGLGLVFSSS